MFCSKCGSQIPDDSLFCNSCGHQINAAHPSSANEEKTRKKEKRKKKINKLAIIIPSSAVLCIALILSTIFVFIPLIECSIARNQALTLIEEGNYIEAHNVLYNVEENIGFDNELYDTCYVKGTEKLLEEGKIIEALSFFEKYHYSHNYGLYDISNIIQNIAINDQEEIFNGVVEALNYEQPAYIDSRNTAKVLSQILSRIPDAHQDVGKLRIFLDDISSFTYNLGTDEEGPYVLENQELLKSLWKYGRVRKMAADNAESFFVGGRWIAEDNITYIEFLKYGNAETVYWKNLNVPDVDYRYYDIENMTLIYCNAGDTKVCDVFKFEFDNENPTILKVYCYADGKTVTLHRD